MSRTLRRWSSFPDPGPLTPEGQIEPGSLNRLERQKTSELFEGLRRRSKEDGKGEEGNGEDEKKEVTGGGVVGQSTDEDAEEGEVLVGNANESDTSFVPALESQPSTDDLDTTQIGTFSHRAPLAISASTPASPTSSHTFIPKKKLKPAKLLTSVVPPNDHPTRPRSQSQVRTRSSEDTFNIAGSANRRKGRPHSRDLPLLPPPLRPAPLPPTAASTTEADHPHPPRASNITGYGSTTNNSNSNTVTASTTPRRRMVSADSTTPSSPIRTVYEPIGGDAIRLGESNPLHPTRDDHEGEEEERDEVRDGRGTTGTLGGRAYTENGISRGGSVTTFHDRGLTTGSTRGGGGFQDLGAHPSSYHHHNLDQNYLPPSNTLSSNLPDLSRTSASSPTAYPIGPSAIQKDLDHSLRALLNQDVFLEMLRDPLGRHRFRIYLRSVGREALLDMWWDADVYKKLIKMIRTGALAMNDAYLTRGSPGKVSGIPSQLVLEVMGNLQQTQAVFSPFTKVQDHLLETLYQTDFQVFIRRKLVEHSQVRLGSIGQSSDGIGGAFVITNPRLRRSSTTSRPPTSWNTNGHSVGGGTGKKLGKLLSRLTSQKTKVSEKVDQLLMGVENEMSIDVGPLDSQIDYFSNTYNKVLVLRPKNQEIVFITHHLLHYLGLPTLSSKAIFSSSLIHMDLVELIDCIEKVETKRVRAAIKLAIRKGGPLTITCGVKVLPGSKWSLTGGRGVSAGEVGLKRTQLRLTPCVDRDGSVSAYIALFS